MKQIKDNESCVMKWKLKFYQMNDNYDNEESIYKIIV